MFVLYHLLNDASDDHLLNHMILTYCILFCIQAIATIHSLSQLICLTHNTLDALFLLFQFFFPTHVYTLSNVMLASISPLPCMIKLRYLNFSTFHFAMATIFTPLVPTASSLNYMVSSTSVTSSICHMHLTCENNNTQLLYTIGHFLVVGETESRCNNRISKH